MTATAQQIGELARDLLVFAADRYQHTLDNLDDLQPGFPASTPGASPASAGHHEELDGECEALLGEVETPDGDIVKVHCHRPRPCDYHDSPVHLTTVELLAGTKDPARHALAQLTDDIDLLIELGRRIIATGDRWGAEPARPKVNPKEKHHWCTNHLQHEICIDAYRSNLCRWCYDIRQREGRLPSGRLVLLKHEGWTVTTKMIRDDHPARRKKKRWSQTGTVTADDLATGKRKCPHPDCTTRIDGPRFACRPHLNQLTAEINAALNRARRKIADYDPSGARDFRTAATAARKHWRDHPTKAAA